MHDLFTPTRNNVNKQVSASPITPRIQKRPKISFPENLQVQSTVSNDGQ